ncbi:hypothetical protein MD484_g2931, partial [Candolleomyces efflorescens]
MTGVHQVLIVNKDFAAGETIYNEFPIVAALDYDLQIAGTHCTHCFREIPAGTSVQSEETSRVVLSAYCSQSCFTASKQQSQSLLFTLESPLPESLMVGPTPTDTDEKRKAAQAAFIDSIKEDNTLSSRNVPTLIARFIARQVNKETAKLVRGTSMLDPTSGSSENGATTSNGEFATTVGDFTDAEEPQGNSSKANYTLADHTERWRSVDVTPPESDSKLLTALLSTALPGLEEFTTAERHASMVGKVLYNAYGVCFGEEGRGDRPVPTARPEDVEKTRTSVGTQKQVGSALYTLSAYLTHSCEPSARVVFDKGTTELHLVAEKPLKKGDVLTIAFVDVKQHDGEGVVECRRRRRIELARGWRFACGCERCGEEAKVVEEEPSAPAVPAATQPVTEEEQKDDPVAVAVKDAIATLAQGGFEVIPAFKAPSEEPSLKTEPEAPVQVTEETVAAEVGSNYATPLETPVAAAPAEPLPVVALEAVAEAATEIENAEEQKEEEPQVDVSASVAVEEEKAVPVEEPVSEEETKVNGGEPSASPAVETDATYL